MKKMLTLLSIFLSLSSSAMGNPTFLPSPNSPAMNAHLTPNQLDNHPPDPQAKTPQEQEARPSLIQEGPDQQQMPPHPDSGEKIK